MSAKQTKSDLGRVSNRSNIADENLTRLPPLRTRPYHDKNGEREHHPDEGGTRRNIGEKTYARKLK